MKALFFFFLLHVLFQFKTSVSKQYLFLLFIMYRHRKMYLNMPSSEIGSGANVCRGGIFITFFGRQKLNEAERAVTWNEDFWLSVSLKETIVNKCGTCFRISLTGHTVLFNFHRRRVCVLRIVPQLQLKLYKK